jgi:hypothetical protein
VVAIHDYPPFVLALPLIAVSYLLYFTGAQHMLWGTISFGWVWTLLLAVTLVMCTFEVDRWATFITALVVVLLPLLSYFLGHTLGMTFIADAWRWFCNLAPQTPGNAALALAIILSVVYVVMLGDVFMDRRYYISHNGLLHKQSGKSDVQTRLGQFRITYDMPNIPAVLLMGAGTIRVYPNVQNTGADVPPLYVIRHVPLLMWGKRHRIEGILSSIETTSRDTFQATPAPAAVPVAAVHNPDAPAAA